MRAAALILAGLALAACSRHAETDGEEGLPTVTKLAAPVLKSSSEPVIRLYDDNRYVRPVGLEAEDPPDAQGDGKFPHPIAVWADGRIVWRINDASFEGKFDPSKLDELVQRLHREGVFGGGHTKYDSYGPDSSFEVIEVRLSDRSLRLASWHEGAERNPGLVGTHRGLEALEGRDKQAVLAATPPEYQRFRRIWSDIRSSVESWVPPQGTPITR